MTESLAADPLLRAGAVVTVTPGRDVIPDDAVAGGNIVAVGPSSDLSKTVSAGRLADAPDGFLRPGLIDADNHLQDSLLKGTLDDLAPGETRLSSDVFSYEHGISDEEAYLAAQTTFAEMVRNGTTCFCGAGGPTPNGGAKAAINVGIRGIVARRGNDLAGPMNCPVDGDVDEVIERASDTVEQWNTAANGRLRSYDNLDLPDNATDELCAAVADSTRQRGVGIVGHFEGQLDRSKSRPRSRIPDVQRYERLGVLGANPSVADVGWIHDVDAEAFARHDVKAVHCPAQSMVGASGIIAMGRFRNCGQPDYRCYEPRGVRPQRSPHGSAHDRRV